MLSVEGAKKQLLHKATPPLPQSLNTLNKYKMYVIEDHKILHLQWATEKGKIKAKLGHFKYLWR